LSKIPDHGWKEAARALEKLGFTFEGHAHSNHMRYWKKGLNRPIIFPKKDSLPKSIVSSILRTGRIDREDYIAALK